MKKRILVLVVGLWAGLSLISCGSYSANGGTGSGLPERVLASQGVTTFTTFGGLVTINGQNDTIPRVAPVSAGTSPGLMAISPGRNMVTTFDSIGLTVYAVDTGKGTAIGNFHIQGLTSSMVIPGSLPLAYAAVPSATVPGFSFMGAVDSLNFGTGQFTTIAVPSAQTVVSNQDGTQLLVFSNGSDAITVLSPNAAVPPVDTSCVNPAPNGPPNPVCTMVQDPRLSRPVNAIVNGNTAYVMNCGFECGGNQQASIALFDMGNLTITSTITVNGATDAVLNGSTLYVTGNGTPTGPLCSSLTNSINPQTAATYCGTLDIVNLSTMSDPYYNNPGMEIAIPNGYHNRMDLTTDGQLFIGSHTCTNIGNVNNPVGEVRGCLAIYNTTKNALVIPPDNGNVDGLQGFTTRYIEYVAEGGNLRVYDTTKDVLYINSDFLPTGSIDIVGYVGDIKAIDFF